MKQLDKIRIGTDIVFDVQLDDSGIALSWNTVEIKHVFLYSDSQRASGGQGEWTINKKNNQVLRVRYAANKQCYLGPYRLLIQFAYQGATHTVDTPCCELVGLTSEEVRLPAIEGTPADSIGLKIKMTGIDTSIVQQMIDACINAAESANAASGTAEEAARETLLTNESIKQQESKRIVAEGERADNETKRQTAEAGRVKAEESRVLTESSRQKSEQARQQAEESRATAEENRVFAETLRSTAESERKKAEETRIASEQIRNTAESARAKAEGVRAAAEQARESAEAKRQKDTASAIKNAETATTEANNAAGKANTAANRADEGANNLGIEDYPVFSAEKSYIADDVVRYSGRLYRFTVAHPAGAWIGTDTETTSVKEELDRAVALKANVDGYYETMRVGTADNLTPRGDASEKIIMSRKTGGDNVIESGDASIKAIKGYSVVHNQYVRDHKFETLPSGSIWYNHGGDKQVSNGELTVVVTTEYSGVSQNISIIKGHKYLSIIQAKSPERIKLLAPYLWVEYFPESTAVMVTQEFKTYISIQTALRTGSDSPIGVRSNIGVEKGTSFTVKNLSMFDLTQMFGVGNEPATAEEFAHRLGYDSIEQVPYIPYNEGEIVSCQADGVRTTGRNLWDEQWELGYYSIDSGHPVSSQKNIRCKNAVPVIPGTKLYFKKIHWAIWYDINDNLLKYDFTENKEITVPDDAHYCRFYFVEEYGTIYKHDACVNISAPSFNGQYEPYDSNERRWTSTMQQYFPNGLKSAGPAYDEITSTRAVKRIGVVDLGALAWVKNSGNEGCYYANIATKSNKREACNVIVAGYTPVNKNGSDVSILDRMPDRSVAGLCNSSSSNSEVYISDSRYTSVKEFIAGVTGKLLYYELATPEEYTYDELNLSMRVAPGYTEEAIIPKGVLSTPLKMDVVYPIDAYGTIVNNRQHIGNLSSLQTQAKEDLVSAINENNQLAKDAYPTGGYMAELYKTAGAVYVKEDGLWRLNGIRLTDKEIANIYRYTSNFGCSMLTSSAYAYTKIKTNFIKIASNNWRSDVLILESDCFFYTSFEIIDLNFNKMPSGCSLLKGFNVFGESKQLHTILGIMTDGRNINEGTNDTYSTFSHCKALKNFKLYGLRVSTLLKDSPLITYATIKYLIDNAANTSAITITFHPTTYSYITGTAEPTEEVGGTKDEWIALVSAAQEKQISLVQA